MGRKTIAWLLCLCLAAALLPVPAARADTDYSWSAISGSLSVASDVTLLDVSFIGNEVWISGIAPEVYHSTDGGASFTAVPLPAPEDNSEYVTSIFMRAVNDVWMVTTLDGDGRVLHWDGTALSSLGFTNVPMHSVSFPPAGVIGYCSGGTDYTGYVGQINSTEMSLTSCKMSMPLYDSHIVFPDADDRVWLSKNFNTDVWYSDNPLTDTWQNSTFPDSVDWIDDLSFTDQSHGWAVGNSVDETIVAFCDGSRIDDEDVTSWFWPPIYTSSDYAFEDIFFISENEGWTVGQDRITAQNLIILHTSDGGYSWTEQLNELPPSPCSGETLLAICMAPDGSAGFAVGAHQRIYKYSEQTTPSCVCEIVGGAQYETLEEAISAVPSNTPTTIRLLRSFGNASTLTVGSARKLTLDLNGFDLTINAASGAALDVGYGGSLTTSGTGFLNLTGVESGIYAHDGGSASVTGTVTATGNTQNHENGSGVLADGSGSGVWVTVNGSVMGDMCGLNVYDGATVTVTGNVTGHNVAVSADTGGEIHIGGSVTGSGVGVGADSATVNITGGVTASGDEGCGVFAGEAAAVTVGAGVTAGQQGVSAANQSQVRVTGDIAVTNGADGGAAIIAESGSEVTVGGSVTGGAYGVLAETGGDIGVQGHISGHYCGINVSESADVTVLGNVFADGTVGVGVNAYSAATATVDGAVSGYKAMTFGESDGALVTPTSKPGYLTYSDGGDYPSFVWVKEKTSPIVETGEILDLTATGALILGKAESGLEVTERGVVYAEAPDPTINTGTAVTATSTGAGEYDTVLTGLSENTPYYVRAYATNALGTAYGACISFTTPVAVSVVPTGSLPQNLTFNSASNKLYIANNIGNSMTVIDGSTDAVLATIPVGKAPYHVAVNETTNRLYVPNNMDNTVSVIDGNTDTIMATVSVGNAPRASAVNEQTNKIYVVNYAAASVSVIDGATNTVTATIPVGSRPYTLAVNETTNRIYVVNYWDDSVSVIDGATDTVTTTVTAGDSPRHITVNETTNKTYIINYRGASVTVLNGADNSTQTVPLETNAYPWAAAVNEATNKVYVANSGTDTVTVIDSDNTTMTIGAGKAPQAVAVNEATNAVYVGNYSTDSRSRVGYIVTKIDGNTNSIVGFACASNPAELAVSSGENKTYVLTGNSVTVIDEAEQAPPTVSTNIVSSGSVTQNTAYVSGCVTTHGTITQTEYGFVYGPAENPVIGSAGVTRLIFGSGVTLTDVVFGLTLTGLTANTAYHVRAYAINDGVTQYGEDRVFATASDEGGYGSGTIISDPLIPGASFDYALVFQNREQIEALPVHISTDNKIGTVRLTGDMVSDYFSSSSDTEIILPKFPGVGAFMLELPALSLAKENAGKALTFQTPYGSVTFSEHVLSALADAEGKTAGITIAECDASGLTEAEKASVGDRPMIRLTLTLDGSQTAWRNPSAPVTVSIPYQPTAEEQTHSESLIIWYLDGSGMPVCVPSGRYDEHTGTVTFKATHFSLYAVGEHTVHFSDVSPASWYHDAVSFLSARFITMGTGVNLFSPGGQLTRGQLLVLLMRALSVPPDENPSDNFSDAGNAYYTGYLAAVKRLGIALGVGGDRFMPDRAVTRQEMFTLLCDILRFYGKMPSGTTSQKLSDFSDVGALEVYAREATAALLEAGLITGSGGRLCPTAAATRAELAQVIYRLLTMI